MTTETQDKEFKSSWRDECLKSLSAFANTDGGELFLGMDDNGKATGLENIKHLLETLPNKINNRLSIMPSVTSESDDGVDYIKVKIDKSQVPIPFEGKYYRRSGSTTQELRGNELTNFLLSKSGKTWDELPIPGASLDDIDDNLLEKFKNLAKDRIPSIAEESNKKAILEKLNLIKDGSLTNAAILLFGKNVQKFFLQARIKIAKFNSPTDYEYEDIVEGNLIEQVFETIDTLKKKYLKSNVSYNGITRQDSLEYPEKALREAVINAIVHRDYSSTSNIQIRVFDDKLSITNEGELPVEVPISKLSSDHISKPRNILIANVFYKAGLIENWGRGTLLIIRECKDAGLPEPDFKESERVLTITFKKSKLGDEELSGMDLNVRQIKAIEYIKEHGKITNKEYRELNDVADETMRRDMKELLNEGIIIKHGKGRSIYYSLKEV